MMALALGACSSLPQPPARADVYDFGPGQTALAPAAGAARLAPVVLADVVASGMPETSRALYYRLAYVNAQQLLPYSQARWSQPPAALVAQALRARLGQQRVVLAASSLGQRMEGGAQPDVLRAELEEFSQVFASPEASSALVRLRVSLSRFADGGEQSRAQRVFIVRRPATTQDAAGGAKALAEAAGQVADEVRAWLEQMPMQNAHR